MFKKNPNRPPMVVSLKRIQGGYKVIPNEGHAIFQVKRIIRTMYRPDLIPQGAALGLEQNGMSIPSTIIQPPSHFTFPAFASWFTLEQIHQIQMDTFPQFFQEGNQEAPFSFGVRNAKLYKYYRNTMVGMWLQNVKKHLSAAHCRRTLAGDVSMIVRIHGFLENWGIINFPSRQHNKGIQVKGSERLTCYVCEQSEQKVYHVAPIQDVIFQLCDNCYREGLYPSEMKEGEFVQVLQKNYKQYKNRLMNRGQLLRLLEIVSSYGGGKDKEKEMWATVQKQFSQFTREELLYNFLRIPTVSKMSSNIFDNNQDIHEQSQPEDPPTIFQDFQNPLQTSIAIAYYKFKQEKGEGEQKLAHIFQAAEKHSKYLAVVQQEKIEELVKMLVDVSFSKLELKSIFIQEYEKLVQKCLLSQKSAVSNTLAETLKANIRFIERTEEPELIEEPQIKESSC